MATGTTRFDKFLPRDYSMQWYVPKLAMPNFEAWDAMLQQQQTQYDTTVALTEKNPQYLQTEEDRVIFQQYKDDTSGALDEITKAYQEQGLSAGNRLLRDKGRAILKEWQPGGRAALLEDRHNSYAAALKQIEETFKDDPRGINKQFATHMLQQQLKDKIEYDPETGKYKKIQTPELYKDPNIQKLALEAIGKIGESGTTDIVKLDDYWFEKIKREGKNPENIRKVTEAILEQFPKQLAIEGWYRGQNTDPEALRKQYETSLDNTLEPVKKAIASGDKMDKKDIASLQNDLVSEGYDIDIDGQFGPKTKQALKDYQSKQEEKIKEMKGKFDPDAYLQGQVKQDYLDFASGFATEKIDKDLIYNKATEFKVKISEDRKRTERIISEMRSLVGPDPSQEISTPDIGRSLENYQKLSEDAEKARQQSKANLNQILAGSLGTVSNNPAVLNEIVNLYKQAGNDALEFQKLIKNSPNMQIRSLDDNLIKNAYDGIRNNSNTIESALTAAVEADNTVSMIQQSNEGLIKTYLEKSPQAKKEFKALYDKFAKEGETEDEFIKSVASKDSRFKVHTPVGVIANAASVFIDNRDQYIKKSKDPDFAKSVNTYTISGTDKSKAFAPVEGLIKNDLQNGDTYGYTSEGKQGFIWRDIKSGKDLTSSIENNKIENMQMEFNTGGVNKGEYKVTATVKKGDVYHKVVSYVDIPEHHTGVVRNSLYAIKANAQNSNLTDLNNTTTLALANLNGDINWTNIASEEQTRLHSKNTQPLTLEMPKIKNGQVVAYDKQPYQGIRTSRSVEVIDGKEVVYERFKVIADGKEKYINTIKTLDGKNRIMSSKSGAPVFSTAKDAELELLDLKYQSELNVLVQANAIPTGSVLSSEERSMVVSGLGGLANSTN